jgi:nucleoside-diphosphate-sugar epimerase
MKVILYGATGMVGQGVLRECLLDPEVEGVLAPVRAPTGQTHEKLREIDLKEKIDAKPYDACFFCLGISSAGMNEADYTKITYDLTLEAAKAIVHPGLTFIYVSGQGTDSTEKGGSMWARVKGKTENALLAMPFKAAYMFRPGVIRPMNGIKSKTALYRAAYVVATPLMVLFKNAKWMTDTERVGKAMLKVGKRGSDKKLLENRDINEVAR